MIQRCDNPKASGYKNYGGRKIAVCARWREFENFLADMGERPPGTSIDRRDNDRGYESGNCRWVTSTEQARSSSRVKMTVEKVREADAMFAVGLSNDQVARHFGIARSTAGFIRQRRSWRDVSRV